ncbi:hypothetical protein FHS83_000270 [Rhizomicrobium palustre]|uniref:Double-GTPase 2 domain-containing protein n=1 Tax=Rhizomicrobium palustre TaxID=189966 RepID=A0A846MV20_9PROT|nr:GTPase [Rhizomicrobium palustre]NIK86952.1 hypothetical protein [Rhizomicrobium palustre]
METVHSFLKASLEALSNNSNFLAALAIAVLIAQSLSLLTARLRLRSQIPISHKIAVIGFPGAGKTTLITALFELIQRGQHLPPVKLHGYNTIKRVNQYIAKLTSGDNVGPTTEQDTFIYRFSYSKSFFWGATTYDVELADFPGQYTDKIAKEDGNEEAQREHGFELDEALFDREFFSWIASAREYLFVIDLAEIYSNQDVIRRIADTTARMRTSWHVIEDAVSERGVSDPRRRNVHIIFTKLDALLAVPMTQVDFSKLCTTDYGEDTEEFKKIENAKIAIGTVGHCGVDVWKLPFGDLPDLAPLQKENEENFRDLIQFFQTRTKFDGCIYSSVKLRGVDGERMGTSAILSAVLP